MKTSTATATARPTAVDRLQSLYASPGPFVSLYLPCGEFSSCVPAEAFAQSRATLATQGASEDALRAIEARLGIPVPDDVGGWAIHAAADGSTAADFAAEGPESPFMQVGALPVAAPLIEWDQWRIPHVTVALAAGIADVVTFLPGTEPSVQPAPHSIPELAGYLSQFAVDEHLRLIMLSGEPELATQIAVRLQGMVPPHTNVVVADEQDVTAEAVAATTVRYVADVVARDTVRALEDFRFLGAGGRTAEGNIDAFAALSSGRGMQLLIHDDPTSPDVASFGSTPTQVSAGRGDLANFGRRADVAIWSAISQGMDVRVIPSTSSNGPQDNIAVTLPRT